MEQITSEDNGRNWKLVDDTEWEFDYNFWRVKLRNYLQDAIYVLYYCANKAFTKCPASLRIYYDLGCKTTYTAEWDKEHLFECVTMMENKGPTANIKLVKQKILAIYASGVKKVGNI